MKRIIYKTISPLAVGVYLIVCLLLLNGTAFAQNDSTKTKTDALAIVKPVKNTFSGVWIIDNQTVMIPVKGTLEMDIQHRFGAVNKGYEDFAGLFAPSNIRLGVTYTPLTKLSVGFGITKSSMLWDVNYKYALVSQTPGRFPVSITYYGNSAYDSRKVSTIYDGTEIKHSVERFSFFHEIIIARKISERLSVQIAPSISHQNAVSGYYTKNDSTGQTIFESMKHDHIAISVSGRFKITDVTSLVINYDQPLTKHATNNPHPNLGVGVEFNTSGHCFQIFLSNYALLNQQRNNLFNSNNPFKYKDAITGEEVKGGQFLIGFNITKLWN
jgi:hypothetical protein